jgi:hypothetical protein
LPRAGSLPGRITADVHDLHRLADPLAVRLRHEAILERLQARSLGQRGELRRQPVPRGHDAAPRRLGAGEGVPGAEAHQAFDRALHPRGVDPLHHRLDARIAPLLRGRSRGEKEDHCEELHRFLRQSR